MSDAVRKREHRGRTTIGTWLARAAAVAFVALMFVRPLGVPDALGMFVIGALLEANGWREFKQAASVFHRRAEDPPPPPPISLPIGPPT